MLFFYDPSLASVEPPTDLENVPADVTLGAVLDLTFDLSAVPADTTLEAEYNPFEADFTLEARFGLSAGDLRVTQEMADVSTELADPPFRESFLPLLDAEQEVDTLFRESALYVLAAIQPSCVDDTGEDLPCFKYVLYVG